MQHRTSRKLAALAAATALGAGAGAGAYAVLDSSPSAQTAVPVAAQPAAATATTGSVNDVYKKAAPGVVEITVTSNGGSSQATPFPFGNPNRQSQAQGSGWVYDTAGHIVTNEHVVDGATSVKVQFSNGKVYSATVVGTDPSTDLAVIKVDAPSSQLHPIALGNSSALEIGDGVVAIGSPFGLEGTVTSGIVSALNRTMTAPNRFAINGAIQTDAAINHGNSGGPLLDLSGSVVGVNAQIESDSGDNAGVGFAIPSNTVKKIVPQLISAGKVAHAYLGVSIADGNGGARVGTVRSGTPAETAGLKAGDLITAVDGKAITTAAELQSAVDAHKPGDSVTLTITRSGSEQTITVKLGSRPSNG